MLGPAATLAPAALLHVPMTDFVLLDANPLDDIHNTTKIDAVIVRGRYLDRAALDSILANAARSLR
jgi:hypothetical protein